MPRRAIVAGQFYPANPERLRSAIESYTPEDAAKEGVLGILSPHAGYEFSGKVAGRAFARAEIPDTVVLLTPSHNFASPPAALWTGGEWETPLGAARLHQPLTEALSRLAGVQPDDRTHLPEHSGEVVLPFLQYHNPQARIAVICITGSARLGALKELGEAIAGALGEVGAPDGLVVASSDMSHESGPSALEVVKRNDALAIEQMEKLDPDGLYQVCRRNNITMCGVLPAVAMMASVKARGGEAGTLIARATSADSPRGGGAYVVGYAGMIFR
ncbi:MAG: AmmeMemoRadiSam system protein B [Planctomycetes bacterium]|nr:AmmeMemoRadiSam system protein B [Planctomycetota bacterium]